ncbi:MULTISPECIES: tetratricopeptide repeat protein [Flavobacterium]|uniref:tetratricopeptide repeat protein n=1 Tax=Flavobacterium TaxID=237 RepID=UPI000A8BF687|nr:MULTISPECIES: flagellar motor protein MotB [Flavobacterium]
MKNYLVVYMIMISIFSCAIYSQNEKKVIVPNKNKTNYSDIDPLKTYERVIEKGYKSADMLKKIGNAYYFNEELDKAAKWYQELFSMNTITDLEPEYYFRYARSLKSINKNDEANEMMKIFNQKIEANTEKN